MKVSEIFKIPLIWLHVLLVLNLACSITVNGQSTVIADRFDYPIGDRGLDGAGNPYELQEHVSAYGGESKNDLFPNNLTINATRTGNAPNDSWYISQDLGSYYTQTFKYHSGEDWNYKTSLGSVGDVEADSAVYSIANGYVVYYGDWGTKGKVLGIRHHLPGGTIVHSIYGHLDNLVFTQSQLAAVSVSPIQVARGQKIGEIGSISNLGDHLHFEIREVGLISNLYPNDYPDGSGYYSSANNLLNDSYIDPSDFIDAHRYSAQPINNDLDIYAGTRTAPLSNMLVWFDFPGISGSSFTISNISINNSGYNATNVVSGSKWAVGGDKAIFRLNMVPGYSQGAAAKLGPYSFSFDITYGGQTKSYSSKKLYFTNIDSFDDIKNHAWYTEYMDRGIRNGLFKGSLNTGTGAPYKFWPNNMVTRAQLVKVVVSAKLQLDSTLQVTTAGTPPKDINNQPLSSSHPLYSYVMTAKSKGWLPIYGAPYDTFYVDQPISIAELAYILNKAFNLVNLGANAKVKHHLGNNTIDVSPYSNSPFLAHVENLNKIYYEWETTNGQTKSQNLGSLFLPTISTYTPSPSPQNQPSFTIQAKNPVSRALMAQVLTNAYLFAARAQNSSYVFPSQNQGYAPPSMNLPSGIENYFVIGNEPEGPDEPVGNLPSQSTGLQSSYTITAGQSLILEHASNYDAANGGVPLFFYWSVNGGDTLETLEGSNRKVRFIPDNVTATTIYNLYTSATNTNGMRREYYIEITVNPAGGSSGSGIAVTPSSMFFSASQPGVYTQNITVNNVGMASATITLAVQSGTAFSVPTGTFTIAPSASISLPISYSPTYTSINNAILDVIHAGGSTLQVQLSGSNLLQATLTPPTSFYAAAYNSNGFELTWSAVSGATQYSVEVAADPAFTNIIFNSNFTNSVFNTVVTPGCIFGDYYCRVRAQNGSNISPWTTITYFYNANVSPILDYANFLPVQYDTLSTNTAVLHFPLLCGNTPATYKLYYGTTIPISGTPLVLTSPTYTLSNLAYNTSYGWRLEVEDADGEQLSTSNFWFTTPIETTAPTGTLNIEAGSPTCNSLLVTLNINATDVGGTVTYMRFSNDGINWTYWYPYQSIKAPWDLSAYGGSTASGVKTVYAQFKDNSNNISQNIVDQISLVSGAKGFFTVRDKTFASLRMANEYAISGDTIWASPGYYDLTSDINGSPYSLISTTQNIGVCLKNGVSLIGSGIDVTTFSYPNTGIGRGFEGAGNNYFAHFTLNGGGVAIQFNTVTNIKIFDCHFKNANNGGGFNYGAGSSNITVSRCIFSGMNSFAFRCNSVNSLKFYNNTLVNNGVGALSIYGSSNLVEIKNNIVAKNKNDAITIELTTNNLTFANNNVWDNKFGINSPVEDYLANASYLSNQTGINNNVSVDPQFNSYSNNDFTLNCGNSPMLNIGANLVGIDFAGTAPDLGYKECNGIGTLSISGNQVSANYTVLYPNGTSTVIANSGTINNLASGVYFIKPSPILNYRSPSVRAVFVGATGTANYYGNYLSDSYPPLAHIHLNADDQLAISPYVTIYSELQDAEGTMVGGLMQFSNDGITWSPIETFNRKKLLWDLRAFGGNAAAGTKLVYARYADNNANWTSIIVDSISFYPTAKIYTIAAVDSAYIGDTTFAMQAGDWLFLNEEKAYEWKGHVNGNYFWSSQSFAKPMKIIGVSNKSTLKLNYSFTFNQATTISNATLKRVGTFNNFSLTGSKICLTNVIFDSLIPTIAVPNNLGRVTISNSVFHHIRTNSTVALLNMNSTRAKTYLYNNLFDGQIPSSITVTDKAGIQFLTADTNSTCNLYNNIIQNFDVSSSNSYGVYLSSFWGSDASIRNNCFFNNAVNIKYAPGVVMTGEIATLSTNPNLNSNFTLPLNSTLKNSGLEQDFYRDHDGSSNDIGIQGGILYNTSPIPNFSITPPAGSVGTIFQLSAAASSDAQTPPNQLQYRWDINGDGVFDTPFMLNPDTSFIASTTDPNNQIVLWVFDEHMQPAILRKPNPAIPVSFQLSTLQNYYCAADTIGVAYNIGGLSFSPNNIFNVILEQLPTGTGTYTIGSVASASNIDTLRIILPNAIAGDSFRVKLQSSAPNFEFAFSNYFSIRANSSPVILNLPTVVLSPGSAFTLQANQSPCSWHINGNLSNVVDISSLGQGSHTVQVVCDTGCSVPHTQTFNIASASSSISVNNLPSASYCAGSNLKVIYSYNGSVTSSVSVVAELSNSTGSFANPLIVGSKPIAASDSLDIILPQNSTFATTYKLRLIATDGLVRPDSTTPFTIKAVVTPTCIVSANTNSVCEGQPITFNASGTNWGSIPITRWLVDGDSAGSGVAYTTSSLHHGAQVQFKVKSSSQCANQAPTTSTTIYPQINPLIQPYSEIYGLTDVVCNQNNDTLYLVTTATSIASYQWLKNGLAISNSNAPVLGIVGSATQQSDNYQVVTSMGQGCYSKQSDTTQIFTMHSENPAGVTVVVSPNDTICGAGQVTLTASGYPNISWSNNIQNGVPFSATTSTYTVTATSNSGCTGSKAVSVWQQPGISLTISPQQQVTSICQGTPTVLSATGAATSINWSGGIANGVTFVPNSSATYTVTASNSLGCTTSQVRTITVLPPPVIAVTATPSDYNCIGVPVTLNASGASSFTISNSVVNGVQFIPSGTTNYTVTGTSSSGCTSSTIKTIGAGICTSCGTDIVISTGPYSILLQESSTFIENSGGVSIDSNVFVVWDAAPTSYVLLQPGFNAKQGSIFVAQAQSGCGGGSPQRLADTLINQLSKVSSTAVVVYPNPTTGLITITHDSSYRNFVIYDVKGAKLKEVVGQFRNGTILDLSSFANGIYFIESKGVIISKVIKE
ncbi:MAG: hypothetical protein RL660_2404 [Bacteroidota bacterium]|jgi:hypothetical protein